MARRSARGRAWACDRRRPGAAATQLVVRLDAASDEAARTPARAALVHELAHLLDRSAAGGFSRDPRLLDLAGWQIGSWPRLKLRLRHNAFTDRTPDAYELFSPQEYVAVNLEHRILDADYACRRPLLDAYFAQRLGSTPQAGRDCAPGVAFFEDRPAAPLLALDPERVYAVDYLLADGNDAPMSRWGHSMLRLVICAPGRPRGPDCRLDLQYQRVLSFRAFIDDVQISSWGGLTGRYPSRLYLLPMLQVIDDYTQGQLRGLRSVPLTLSRAQIAALLQRAAQVHWSYDGGYRFASNNCAFETYKLLRDGVPALDAGGQLSGITPNGLLRRLEQARIADGQVLADLEQAGRAGYYFAPASAQYQAMLDIARARLGLPAQSVEDWLSQPPQRRAPWIERADLRASAALLVLEQAARRRQDLLARDALKRRFLHGEAMPTWMPAAPACATSWSTRGCSPSPRCCCRASPATACRNRPSATSCRRRAARCSAGSTPRAIRWNTTRACCCRRSCAIRSTAPQANLAALGRAPAHARARHWRAQPARARALRRRAGPLAGAGAARISPPDRRTRRWWC